MIPLAEIERFFPPDFMFQLSTEEASALRSQSAASKPGRGGRRYLSYTFTEHGAIMLANVLNIPHTSALPTRVLNQAVKRNPEKFPGDFVFQLTFEEAETVQRSRSHIVIMKRGLNIKYLPYAVGLRSGAGRQKPT